MLKARKPCRRPSCPGYQFRSGLCEYHYRQHWMETDARRGTPTERGYDRHWRVLRRKFLQVYPNCFHCGQPATQVHHVIPLSEGGDSRWDNLEAMCHSCHSRITGRANSPKREP